MNYNNKIINLINYLPLFLQDVEEFKEIFKAENTELEKLKDMLFEILEEIDVETAKSYGLDRYEEIYKINKTSNDVSERRNKILYKINSKLPYTYRWLEEKLRTLVGDENYFITLDNENYSLNIEISGIYKDAAEILKKDLRLQVPANMAMDIKLFQIEQAETCFGAFLKIGDFIMIRQVD